MLTQCYQYLSMDLASQLIIIIKMFDFLQSIFEYLKHQSPKLFLFKLISAILLLACFLVYRFLYEPTNPDCILDRYHVFTGPINKNLEDGFDNVIIGIGQVMIDLWVIICFILWFVAIQNMRFPLAAGAFFLIRSAFLQIQKLPFPDNMVWHSPGFFSLTVPYDRTRDFFYSGHTGTLVLMTNELYKDKFGVLTYIAFASVLFMINMLTITRVHYTIDVIGGVIFANFSFTAVGWLVKYLDWIVSLPYFIVVWIIRFVMMFRFRSANDLLKSKIIEEQLVPDSL